MASDPNTGIIPSASPTFLFPFFSQVKENAQKQAENMDAYVMLSFDTYEAKAAFCERFGYEANMKFIKGEVFDEQIERID